ncbi:MAG: hypothetical protein NQU42_06950 [Methanothrix sp.]|uniref:hypothetical protein n=1 Tax=Methanothrix sp. TaxID=90426 RepID=UPI0025EEE87C|nr:hypothetical protein [Methanothrix sp.]MCQ8903810.1 hypothetical protein [Methanothrix sp.]
MRIIALIVMLFISVPQVVSITGDGAQQVGGDFGKAWLQSLEQMESVGVNRTIAATDGLWSWGSVPKWHMLVGGRLEYMGSGVWFYPAFPTNSTPIIENASLSAKNAPDFASPEMLNDPWMIAQVSGRPVLFRSLI